MQLHYLIQLFKFCEEMAKISKVNRRHCFKAPGGERVTSTPKVSAHPVTLHWFWSNITSSIRQEVFVRLNSMWIWSGWFSSWNPRNWPTRRLVAEVVVVAGMPTRRSCVAKFTTTNYGSQQSIQFVFHQNIEANQRRYLIVLASIVIVTINVKTWRHNSLAVYILKPAENDHYQKQCFPITGSIIMKFCL